MLGPKLKKQCPHEGCAFSTSQGSDMAKHLRTHSGERPYACDSCSYAAARSDQLSAHKRRHTGERPYACTFPRCDYKAVTAGTLRAHKKTHIMSGLPCDVDGCGMVVRAEGVAMPALAAAFVEHLAASHHAAVAGTAGVDVGAGAGGGGAGGGGAGGGSGGAGGGGAGGGGGAADHLHCAIDGWAAPSPNSLWAHNSTLHPVEGGGGLVGAAAGAAAAAPANFEGEAPPTTCQVPGCGYTSMRPASLAAHERAHERTRRSSGDVARSRRHSAGGGGGSSSLMGRGCRSGGGGGGGGGESGTGEGGGEGGAGEGSGGGGGGGGGQSHMPHMPEGSDFAAAAAAAAITAARMAAAAGAAAAGFYAHHTHPTMVPGLLPLPSFLGFGGPPGYAMPFSLEEHARAMESTAALFGGAHDGTL
jgi:hypothetical protein